MKIEINTPLFLIGDIHGLHNFPSITNGMKGCTFIQIGDFGLGFSSWEKDYRSLRCLSNKLTVSDCKLLAIRGNHDNPKWFDDSIFFDRITLLKDYSVVVSGDKTLLLVGGGISIDRVSRKNGLDYWIDEPIKYEEEKIIKCDYLITHPTSTKRIGLPLKGSVVDGWLQKDPNLLQDLIRENDIIDKLLVESKCKCHYYGHMHMSRTDYIDGVKHVGINIGEVLCIC